MKITELERLPQLQAKIRHEREKLAELRSEAYSTPAPVLSGMPKSRNIGRSRVEKYAVKIAELEKRLERKELEALRLERRIWQFTTENPDSEINVIVVYRFIFGMTWGKVAKAMSSSKAHFTESGVKTRFTRFWEARPEDR